MRRVDATKCRARHRGGPKNPHSSRRPPPPPRPENHGRPENPRPDGGATFKGSVGAVAAQERTREQSVRRVPRQKRNPVSAKNHQTSLEEKTRKHSDEKNNHPAK